MREYHKEINIYVKTSNEPQFAQQTIEIYSFRHDSHLHSQVFVKNGITLENDKNRISKQLIHRLVFIIPGCASSFGC